MLKVVYEIRAGNVSSMMRRSLASALIGEVLNGESKNAAGITAG